MRLAVIACMSCVDISEMSRKTLLTKMWRCDMNVERTWLTSLGCVLALGLGLAGCGQGSGDNGGAGGAGETGMTGTLLGGPISGVSFETETHSGVTSEDGTFRYEEGETVRFFIGDTVLGETEGRQEITLFDLVSNAEPLKGEDTISAAVFNRCHPLVSVINMEAFLETLDQDNNPGNGIRITSEIAALFEGASIDFAQRIFDFRQDRDLRTALSRANAEELFESHRQVRSGAYAAQGLYASLGIDAELFVVLRYERDEGADDSIDSISESQYDERAQNIRFSRDSDANGEPDSINTSEYDENGHQLRSVSDTDGDGNPNRITRNVYNEDGDRIRTERDSDGDGDVDSTTTTSYDDIGRLLRHEEDEDNNGTPDRIVTYWYDDDARQNGSREDEDGDGLIDRSTTNFFDENGYLIRRDVDAGDDGTVNSRDLNEVDPRGNTTRRERDRDGDGELDDIDIFEYNEMCLRTYQEEQEGDGTVNRTTTTVYDEAGRQLSRSTDSDADGMPDSIDTNEYDDSGKRVFSADDNDADGAPDSTQTFEYTNGALSRVLTDQDADGMPDRIEYYTSQATNGWVRLID